MNVGHYSKSILAIIAAAIGILVAALSDNVVTPAELVNVGIAIVTAVGVYLVPNIPAGPARYLKTGVALAGAALTALASFISDGVTLAETLQIALAALAAIGVYVIPNSGSQIDVKSVFDPTALAAELVSEANRRGE